MHPTLLTAATEALDAFRAFRTALNHEEQRDAEELLESAMERLGEAVRREEGSPNVNCSNQLTHINYDSPANC